MTWKLQLRSAFFALVCCAAFFLAPAAARPQDPVRDLENALKIDPQQLVEPVEQRKQVDKILPRLKTLSELRAAYFLKEWLPHVKYDKDKKEYHDEEMFKRRKSIGEALQKAVFEAAKEAAADRKIAIAIMIAEMAERDQPEDRSKSGKFASAFVDVLIGKNGLVNSEDARVKQAGWHALGKITPKPDDGLKKKLREALASPELGVRRVAAYALSDLIKNAHYFDVRSDELDTMTIAVTSAGFGLRQLEPAEDEFVRAYCLQAIFQAGRIFTDYGKATENAYIDLEKDEVLKEDKQVVNPKLRDVLAAINAANPRIAAAAKHDHANTVELRLTALET